MKSLESAADPAALFDQGNALLERGAPEAAAVIFRQCLMIAPHHAGVRYNLANALLCLGRTIEAVEALIDCLRLAPDFGAAYVNLANALRQLTLLDQAQAMAEQGLRCLPDLPEAKLCLANVLHDRGGYDQAASLYQQVLDQMQTTAARSVASAIPCAHCDGRPEALAMHDRAIAAAPNNPEFRFNRAVALLAAGDYARGWSEYERRWHYQQSWPRGFGEAWRGQDITGRTILLHAEQGLGDTLQFVRYLPLVIQRGAHVVLEVQPSLVRLMQRLPCFVQVVARGEPLPPFDIHCPLLSLPLVFGTRLNTIPAELPYLHADPVAAAAWREKLPGDGVRVGLVWAGSPHADDAGARLINQRRSLDFASLSVLEDVAGVHLVSLQKDRPNPLTQSMGKASLIDPMPQTTDFADTAALVANLDVVISVDTSVAHLAGGLGKPVWLLSRYDGVLAVAARP